VGPDTGPVAPAHLAYGSSNTFTNSAFLLFLRVPAGRAATLKYLRALRAFDGPVLVSADHGRKRLAKFSPNPKVPALPEGTEVALVRRALLVASPNTVTATALTESVQLRVYREIPSMSPETLEAALGGGTAAGTRARAWQAAHEFRLSRGLLFAGKAGGLRAVGADERDFKNGFGAHPWDEFERPLRPGQSFPGADQQFSIRESCFACHSLPGVYSFNSYFNFRVANTQDGDDRRPASLGEVSPSDALGSAVRWKEKQASWTTLRRLLPE
jgi:hypothetical protein